MTISPTSATVAPGATQVFTASEAVDWSCSAGSIDSKGHYTAPLQLPGSLGLNNHQGPTSCVITTITKGATNFILDAFFNFGFLIKFGAGNAVQVTVALSRQSVTLTEKRVQVPAGGTHQFTANVANCHASNQIERALAQYGLHFPIQTGEPTYVAPPSSYCGTITPGGPYTAPAQPPG